MTPNFLCNAVTFFLCDAMQALSVSVYAMQALSKTGYAFQSLSNYAAEKK